MKITTDQLKKIIGTNYTDDKITKLVDALNQTFEKYEINTQLRICHFLAQVIHESGSFKAVSENLNYSADGLMKIFPKYFTSQTVNNYARKPEMIANHVYCNRMGNGDEKSGEGFKFRGRGFMQITGKSNYLRLKESLQIDIINKPELLEQLPYCMLSAGWYWSSRLLNSYADKDNILAITKAINGGTIGLNDRKLWLTKCKNVIK
jgi:putative chitinase